MRLYKKRWFKISASILLVLILAFGAFYIYTLDYYHATPAAVETMKQTQTVSVRQSDNMILFSPNQSSSDTGLVFYPGGKVEYTAYAPLMMELCKQGIPCVLLKMPFNLAVFDINGADRAIKALPNVKTWYIGGHSLGGAMASSYAAKNDKKLAGIILLGAYPSSDLSKTKLNLLCMYGTKDGVLNRQKFNESKVNSPQNTKYIEIAGGNHAYFGTYGEQKGDGTATITQKEQQKITVQAIANFIKNS